MVYIAINKNQRAVSPSPRTRLNHHASSTKLNSPQKVTVLVTVTLLPQDFWLTVIVKHSESWLVGPEHLSLLIIDPVNIKSIRVKMSNWLNPNCFKYNVAFKLFFFYFLFCSLKILQSFNVNFAGFSHCMKKKKIIWNKKWCGAKNFFIFQVDETSMLTWFQRYVVPNKIHYHCSRTILSEIFSSMTICADEMLSQRLVATFSFKVGYFM